MSLRWEEQREGSWYARSGQRIVGMVVPLPEGDERGKVAWQIGTVTASRHQPATSGNCASVNGAKGALRRAWSTWLRERGLTEAS